MSEPLSSDPLTLAGRAVELARRWAREAEAAEVEPADARLAGLLGDASARRFAVEIADGVMRTESLGAAASQLRRFAPTVPSTLPWYVRGTVRLGGGVAPILPSPVVPIARRMLREVLRPLVVDGRAGKLGAEFERIARSPRTGHPDEGASDATDSGIVGLDLSILGASALGEAQARRRLDGLHDLIRAGDVDHISFPVSSVIAPGSPWAFDERVEQAVDRLTPLCVTASAEHVVVTLDVEEHRDLDLTIAVFTRLLENPELKSLHAAIVLPTSLPDALPALQELTAWAQDRVDHGGAPISVRLAKGTELPLERREALLHGWTPAHYDSPLDADANQLRCLDWALRPERTRAVRVGVVGHDLGITAYAWLLAQDRGVDDALEIVRMHGSEPARTRAVARETGRVLLRAAVVPPAEFDIAIGRLIRQIDACAASDEDHLIEVVRRSTGSALRIGARRTQNRLAPVHESARPSVQPQKPDEQLTKAVLGITRGSDDESFFETAVYSEHEIEADAGGAPGFDNAPDSDPSLPANREWARGIFGRIRQPSMPERAASARPDDLDAVLALTREAGARWGSRPAAERADTLLRAAAAIEGRRGDLIETAAREHGLLFTEGDVEVSRAVDCARYYAATSRELDAIAGAAFEPAALTVVAPSWQAPIADAAEGVLAALAAGSAVVLSPDPRASRTAASIAETLWQVGVPREALVIVDAESATQVFASDPVDRAILGESRRAEGLSGRPGLPMLAETGGGNAVIVTGSADLDQAASDIALSAFTRAGQARGAAGILILVGSAGRSKRFAAQLADVTRSLHTGWPGDPHSQVGPLVERPQGGAEWALTELDDDEQWLVQPRPVGDDPSGRLWTPGIRIGVRPGSRFHLESHGVPVIGIMHAATMEKAIELQNRAGSGSVAGLHTRDAGELAQWLEEVEAGGLFVNRCTTGAVVQRQPDGLWRSSIGPGAKSGGPHRLIGLGSWRSRRSATLSSTLHLRGLDSRITAIIEAAQSSLDYEAFEWLRRAALSDALAWDREFGQVRDVSKLGVERNLLRYRPVPVEVRVAADARLQDLLRVAIAAVRAGSPFVLSLSEGLPAGVRHALAELQATIYLESDEEWLERGLRQASSDGDDLLVASRAERVRLVGGADAVARLREQVTDRPGGGSDLSILDGEVTSAGRVELLSFVREQSISITAHRGGVPDDWSSEVI